MINAIRNYIKINKSLLFCGFLCFTASIVLILISKNSTAFSQWNATYISPLLVNTIGRFSNIFHISIFELLLALIALGVLASLIYILFIKRVSPLPFSLAPLCLSIVSLLFLIFTLTAFINYNKPLLAAGNNSTVREYTSEDLTGLAHMLVDDINELSEQIKTDEYGLLDISHIDLNEETKKAMGNLSKRYPLLKGYYPNPKPIFLSKAMSYLGVTGIFSPFTLEANYNNDVDSFIIPYTICHEFAHLKGYMREDEAGFLGYLACINSDYPEFRYSGTLNALQYTLGQLYENVDNETYNKIYARISDRVINEVRHSSAYWHNYKSKATTVAKTVNDKYLMVNAQDSGTKSYGMMVEFLLKEYEHLL